MTEQEGRQYPTEIDKLRQLAEFLPEANPVLYEFSTLLANCLDQSRKITPLAFVFTASLLVKDLERGIDGFTGKPIRSKLVGYPQEGYRLLEIQIPTIARAIYPADFADNVDSIFQEFEKRKQHKGDQS